MSATQDRHGNGDGAAPVTARLARLEAAFDALDFELRTRRLTVIDDRGAPRITAEVVDGVAELRVELAASPPVATPAVLVFAASSTEPGNAALEDPAIGVQLWADGDGLVELVASPDANGRWRPHVYLGDM